MVYEIRELSLETRGFVPPFARFGAARRGWADTLTMQPNAQGETGMDQGNYDVSTLNHYLKGTNFPASKEEVASNAEGNGAPQDLVVRSGVRATAASAAPRRSCRRSKARPTPPTLCKSVA